MIIRNVAGILSVLVLISIGVYCTLDMIHHADEIVQEPVNEETPVYDITVCRFTDSGEKCTNYPGSTMVELGTMTVKFTQSGSEYIFSGNGYDFYATRLIEPKENANDRK